MVVVKSPCEMQGIARKIHGGGKTIAVVPTMGFLHEGHLSLVDQAKKEADVVVLTLFVNPIQFGPNEDYAVYPRDQKRDEALCEARGVDYLFAPEVGDMYSPDASVKIDENSLSRHLCGAVSNNRCHHNGWRHGDHGSTLSRNNHRHVSCCHVKNRLLNFHLSMNLPWRNLRCLSWPQSHAQRCAACGSGGRHRR